MTAHRPTTRTPEAQKAPRRPHTALFAVLSAGRVLGRQVAALYRRPDPDAPRSIESASSWIVGSPEPSSHGERTSERHERGLPPVVYVHEVGGGRGDLLLLSWYLRLWGRHRAYRLRLPGAEGLEEQGALLASLIDRIRRRTKERQVDLVAHGVGGLVAREAIQKRGAAPAVRTLVTLGTPHHGTRSARFDSTPLSSDVHPHSPVLKRLNGERWPRCVRAFTFWSTGDHLVVPPTSALVEGFVAVDMSPLTHFGYLVDPKSWDMVRLVLDCDLAEGEEGLLWYRTAARVSSTAPVPAA